MKDWHADYSSLLNASRLSTLQDRRRYLKLCFMFKIVHHLVHVFVSDLLLPNSKLYFGLCRAVASGLVDPVLAGPTLGAGGCGKRQSARATCAHGAGGGEIESYVAAIDRSFIQSLSNGYINAVAQSATYRLPASQKVH